MSGHCPECQAVTAHRQAHRDNCPHATPKPGGWVLLQPGTVKERP